MIKLAFNKVLNKHVKFYEDNHVYKMYDKDSKYEKALMSGTKFIGNFFPKFEREKIATAIAKRDNRNIEDIYQEWDKTSKIATDFGTKVHLYGEKYIINGTLPIANNEKEEHYFSNVKQYLDRKLNNGWELVEAEKMMFNNYIAGTADLLLVNHKEKLYSLEDWKTNKKIDSTSYRGDEYGFDPIQNLQNCSLEKYRLQLNLYSYLLKQGEWLRYPEYRMNKTILHINYDLVDEYVVPDDYEIYIKKMIQKLFKVRIR